MAHPDGRNSYEHRRKERDLRSGADRAWCWRRIGGNTGAHRWNPRDRNDHDYNNVAWKASCDRPGHHDKRDHAERK